MFRAGLLRLPILAVLGFRACSQTPELTTRLYHGEGKCA